jgi:hypothetical protein
MCVKVDVKQHIAEIKLLKDFYPKDAVEEAIKSFKGVEISKKEEKTYFHISMKAKDANVERLALEFCNLLLAIIKGSAL